MVDLITNLNDSNIEVFFQESAILEIDVALNYIKTGEDEIKKYVDDVAKPEIVNLTEEKKQEILDIADEIKDYAEFIEQTTNDPNVIAVGEDLRSEDSKIISVSQNISDINIVADSLDKIDEVSLIASDIKNVSDNIANINTVALDKANIDAVAANKANIDAVNANKINIDTVATNIADVNTVADNIDDIKNAYQNAQTAITAKNETLTIAESVEVMAEDVNANKELAKTYADNAKLSETNAKASEDAAAEFADLCENRLNKAVAKAAEAVQAATDASNSSTAAATSATEAAQSATSASDSASLAQSWAIGDIDSRPEGSSKYWAERAQSVVVTDATEEIAGVVELATEAEAIAGQDTKKVITPNTLLKTINNKLGTVYKYKGSVANYAALPTINEVGDVYNTEDTGANYAWTGTEWDNLGGTVDLTGYYTKTQTDNTFVKQTTTINNKDLSSNISLTATDVNALPNTTKYGSSLSITDKTLQLKDQDGSNLGTAVNIPDTVYTAGDGIAITDNVISNTRNSAEWGNITGTLSSQTDLNTALNSKANSSTTLSGYGITDAYTKTEIDSKFSSGETLPDQTNNSGKYLTTDGQTASWGGEDLLKYLGNSILSYNTLYTYSFASNYIYNIKGKIIVPNGFYESDEPKYDKIDFPSISRITFSSVGCSVFINQNSTYKIIDNDRIFLGPINPAYTETALTEGRDYIWFDTTNNKIKCSNDLFINIEEGYSLPIIGINRIGDKFYFDAVGGTILGKAQDLNGNYNTSSFRNFVYDDTNIYVCDGFNTNGLQKNLQATTSVYVTDITLTSGTEQKFNCTYYINNLGLVDYGSLFYNNNRNLVYLSSPAAFFPGCELFTLVTDSAGIRQLQLNSIQERYATKDEISNFVTLNTAQEITANKIFTCNNSRTNPINIKSTDWERDTTLSAAQYRHLEFLDKNDVRVGVLEMEKDTSNNHAIQMIATNPSGTGANIKVGIKTDGTAFTYAPACNWNNSILTNVAMSGNNVKFGNGMILNSGWISNGSTVTFSYPYSSSSYIIVNAVNGSNNGYYSNQTATGFKCNGAGFYYIAWGK